MIIIYYQIRIKPFLPTINSFPLVLRLLALLLSFLFSLPPTRPWWASFCPCCSSFSRNRTCIGRVNLSHITSTKYQYDWSHVDVDVCLRWVFFAWIVILIVRARRSWGRRRAWWIIIIVCCVVIVFSGFCIFFCEHHRIDLELLAVYSEEFVEILSRHPKLMGYKNNKILDNLDYVGKKEKSQRVKKGI